MTDVLPEFPLPTTVPALGYVEVTDEVATGFVVLHEIVTPQLLFPEVMVQEGTEREPDMDGPDAHLLPSQLVPLAQVAEDVPESSKTELLYK